MNKITVISLFIVLCLLFTLFSMNFTLSKQGGTITSDKLTEIKVVSPKQPKHSSSPALTTRATLMSVGDILIHENVYSAALTGSHQYNFAPMFDRVKPYLQGADITMANQETMIGGSDIGVATYPRFNSPFEVGDALKEAGIDIVSIANNHTLDHGEKAILNALNHWARIDMTYTGAFRSSKDRNRIRLIRKNNIRFSFLSYTYGTNGIPVPDSKPYLVILINRDLIQSEVKKAKEISDVVVVSLHFGSEYQQMPNNDQKQLAKVIANAGANVIIGHPHVLQPPAWIKQPDGNRTFVVYSLGNFLSAQRGDGKDIGGIVQLEVVKTVQFGRSSIKLVNPAFIPTWVDHRFTIQPLVGMKDMQKTYLQTKKHMTQWVPKLQFLGEDQFNTK